MRRFKWSALSLLIVAATSFAKTHKTTYSIPCATVWPAVKDTVRNSEEEYRILWMDNSELVITFAVGGQHNVVRIDSVVLNANGDSCEMVLTGPEAGLSPDASSFKKAVDASLAKRQPAKP
jgi:hypothetical protein